MRGDERERTQALLRMAEEAGRVPAWAEYALYCRARERGLRPRALGHLDAFLRAAVRWPFPERREFAGWLARALENPDWERYDLSPHPLVVRLLRPTLLEWTEREPASPLPHRWLGMFFSAYAYTAAAQAPDSPLPAERHLRRALELDPGEQPARIHLVRLLLERLYFAAHHLPAVYLGDPGEDLALAAEVARLVEGVAEPGLRSHLRGEAAAARRLVEDWIAFQRTGGGDFDEWCRLHGRTHSWQRHYYFPGE